MKYLDEVFITFVHNTDLNIRMGQFDYLNPDANQNGSQDTDHSQQETDPSQQSTDQPSPPQAALNMIEFTDARVLRVYNPSVNEASAATWSKESGQDDIKWTKMVKNADGWWEANIPVNYFVHSGEAYAHVYSGKSFLNGITFNNPAMFAIAKAGEGAADRTITVTDTYGVLKAPKIAVWSFANGQDDLKWYDLKKNGSAWSVTVPTKNLAHDGKVAVHCYDGKSYIIGTDYEIPARYDITAEVNKNGNETVTVTDKTGSLTSLKAAVWTENGGQDDLKWYNMAKGSDLSWSVNAPLSNLKHTGRAIAHVYSGQTFVNGIAFNV